MTKFFSILLSSLLVCSLPLFAHEGEHEHPHAEEVSQNTQNVMFTPPTGWRFADQNSLSKCVKVMVVGKGEYDYPPSMNLSTEPFAGSLKEYLKIVKNLNEAKGVTWKDLGKIKTEAGDASLSQLDLKTEWGNVRMMHVILVNSGQAYILTSASRKEEFPKFYKEFFSAMRSLRIDNEKPKS